MSQASFDPETNPHLNLSVGTQVVVGVEVAGPQGTPAHPRGAVGVVVQAPGDGRAAYRVRFADGFEASLDRGELAILSQFKAEGFRAAFTDGDVNSPGSLAAHGMYEHVIYRCVVGSRAFGLDDADSDTDRRGIYLPPAERHWSLYGVPEQLENPATEEVYWELQKFLTLALKANPNVLECLYTPLVETATPLAEELLALRDKFLSKLVYQTFNGYVASQFKKLSADLRLKGAPKWKHVMHLLRLLLSGIITLEEGYVPVRVGRHRDTLVAIKHGQVPWDEVEAWRVALHAEFDAAFTRTKLPDRPDYEAVNALLLKARRSRVAPDPQ